MTPQCVLGGGEPDSAWFRHSINLAAGPARQDFTIATRGLDGDPRGDSDIIQFDRPEAGQ